MHALRCVAVIRDSLHDLCQHGFLHYQSRTQTTRTDTWVRLDSKRDMHAGERRREIKASSMLCAKMQCKLQVQELV